MTVTPQRTNHKRVPPRRGANRNAPSSTREREDGQQRIAKLLARAGVASRREIERMIAEGRIALHGEKLDLAGVTVDGKPVRAAAATRLFRFYKPQRTLTAANDPKNRPTIYDRLPEGLPRLMPVGRLDYMTEGLLLLTNDGELKRQLELPKTGVTRTYRARAFGAVTQAELEALAEGITIAGVRYGSINANLERRTGRNCWIEMSLTEGKNREVRNVLEHLGLQISRLIRTAYGPFTVAGLEPGDVDEVRTAELAGFRATLK
jgi:23S rRNA pseudouridine2605 synthase